ncbi:MAG: hypothetical protein ACRCYY_19105 [Trueperaceae bacterium]
MIFLALELSGREDVTIDHMEESVEGFIQQYKPYAANVEVLPKTEGSPLLEIVANHRVLHLLERTAPYQSKPGKGCVLINPMTENLAPSSEHTKTITVPILSKMHVQGVILELTENVAIVDAGVPLIVSLLGNTPEVNLGDYVSFDSLSPIHGFVVMKEETKIAKRGRETDSEI